MDPDGTTEREPRTGVRRVPLFLLLLVLVLAANLVLLREDADTVPDAGTAAPLDPGIDLRADLETGDARQFDALECAEPDRQFQVVRSPVRQGVHAARFEQRPGDAWENGSIRCLGAIYDSGEQQGDSYFYALSAYFPAAVSDNVIWELHSRRDIYEVDPNTSVSPHALGVVDGALAYRLLAGPAFWNGAAWTGWSYYEPAIPLLPEVPLDTWIDIVVRIDFSRFEDGVVQVWVRTGDDPWPLRPQVERQGVPTLQWIPGYDERIWGTVNDPAVPETVPPGSLYTALGLYSGAARIEVTDVVVLDGYRRGVSLDAVMADFR
ncbi:Polysaccharide lyase [Blastococcus fimeti]|nr:Polysaccharide lyase [Blastococcus fimeti]